MKQEFSVSCIYDSLPKKKNVQLQVANIIRKNISVEWFYRIEFQRHFILGKQERKIMTQA